MAKVTSKSVLRRISIQKGKQVYKCKTCKGTGKVTYAHSYHDIRNKRMCLTCSGKGYVTKKEVI